MEARQAREGSLATLQSRSAIIISASSDIGAAMCHRWLEGGWNLSGTYRTPSPSVKELRTKMGLVRCDLADTVSVSDACAGLRSLSPEWDVLVLAPGSQEPVWRVSHACEFFSVLPGPWSGERKYSLPRPSTPC